MDAADFIAGAFICLVLFYGTVCDARKRIIPDRVPIALGIIGLFACLAPDNSIWQIPLSERIAGFALPTAIMLALYLLKKPVGGGDLKLSAALGFLLGLTQFALTYAIGGVIALVWAGIRKQKSVPLAVFLTIGVVICLML